MSIGFHASLTIAKLDLYVVRLLRRAMNSHPEKNCSGSTRFEERKVIHPEPRIEQRRVFHPNPTYAPRLVDRHKKTYPEPVPSIMPIVVTEPCPHRHAPTLQPPWKSIPWKNPPPPAQVIKAFRPNPDKICKGMIVDCFF